MERIIEDAESIINENEKVIANILHDIKSPLYSIKIGLQNKLDSELNRDIFETTLDILKYIENFLVNYNFKLGRFDNKISPCDVKKIIDKKLENYKYIFLDKNIHIDMILENEEYTVNSIEIFLSSIIGNIISNIALHASKNKNAYIEIYKKNSCILVDFKNSYNSESESSSLGLEFCSRLAQSTKVDIKLSKTKDSVCVSLKIPQLKGNLKRQIVGI